MPDEIFRPRESASEREITGTRRSTIKLAVQKALTDSNAYADLLKTAGH